MLLVMSSSSANEAHARLSVLSRWHGPDDPRTIEARRAYAVEKIRVAELEILAMRAQLAEDDHKAAASS
jgi:hypothetical protein